MEETKWSLILQFNHHRYRVIVTTAALVVTVSGAFAVVSGQNVASGADDRLVVARTPWGHPDLEGIWAAGYLLTPLERPAEYVNREFLTDQEVAALEKAAADSFGKGGGASSGPRLAGGGRPARGTVADVEGAYNDAFSGRGIQWVRSKRTSLIVDPPEGKIPPRTAEGEQRARRAPRVVNEETGPSGQADDPEDRVNDRCMGVRLPIDFGSATESGGMTRIVQGPASVTFYYEHGHYGGAYRTIPLDRTAHLPPQTRQWLGDGIGRWEGDTLVVDTTNFTNRTNYRGSRENLHLVERFTRTAPDTLLYRVTVEDSTTFTKPWTIEVPMLKHDEKANQIFESSCHEGNYALTGILAGAREMEKAPANKKSRR